MEQTIRKLTAVAQDAARQMEADGWRPVVVGPRGATVTVLLAPGEPDIAPDNPMRGRYKLGALAVNPAEMLDEAALAAVGRTFSAKYRAACAAARIVHLPQVSLCDAIPVIQYLYLPAGPAE